MPTDIAKYSIELFKPGGEGAGIEEILDRHADLKVSRSIYRASVEKFPGRLIMLCDGAQCWPEATGRRLCRDSADPSCRRLSSRTT